MSIKRKISVSNKLLEGILDNPKNEVVESSDESLEHLLDRVLEMNLARHESNEIRRARGDRPRSEYVNVLVVGRAGTGKTSRIQAWADRNNVNLLRKAASIMDEADLSGVPVANMETKTADRFDTSEFKGLDTQDSVLFLDELNRARSTLRGTLLTLIQDHLLQDVSNKENTRYLPNLLFTIAAVNPSDDGDYNTETLDAAERTRFIIYVEEGADKFVWFDYFKEDIEDQMENVKLIAKRGGYKRKDKDGNEVVDTRLRSPERMLTVLEGRLKIAETLVNSPNFKFDGDTESQSASRVQNNNILSFRTLSNSLNSCDGTKDDFLVQFRMAANKNDYDTIKAILANYKDVEDKANQVLDDHHTEEPMFQSVKQKNKASIGAWKDKVSKVKNFNN